MWGFCCRGSGCCGSDGQLGLWPCWLQWTYACCHWCHWRGGWPGPGLCWRGPWGPHTYQLGRFLLVPWPVKDFQQHDQAASRTRMLELQCAYIKCFQTFCVRLGRCLTLIPLFPRRYLIGTRVDAASEGEKGFRTLAVCKKRSFPALQSPFSRCPRAFFELAVLHLRAICEVHSSSNTCWEQRNLFICCSGGQNAATWVSDQDKLALILWYGETGYAAMKVYQTRAAKLSLDNCLHAHCRRLSPYIPMYQTTKHDHLIFHGAGVPDTSWQMYQAVPCWLATFINLNQCRLAQLGLGHSELLCRPVYSPLSAWLPIIPKVFGFGREAFRFLGCPWRSWLWAGMDSKVTTSLRSGNQNLDCDTNSSGSRILTICNETKSPWFLQIYFIF